MKRVVIEKIVDFMGWGDSKKANISPESQTYERGTRIKNALMGPFTHITTLSERDAANSLIDNGIAENGHDARSMLKAIALKGGVMCDCVAFLGVRREEGNYHFHHRVANEADRAGRNSYK